MILIYAFSNRWATNISRLALSSLQERINNSGILFIPINTSPHEFFRKHIEHQNYSLIIGLGDGSKYIDKINIETIAQNSYNRQSIYPYSPVKINLSLPDIDDFDRRYFNISSNMGTYNCNYMAYRTQLHISQSNFATHQLFFHLPPKSNAIILADRLIDFFCLNHLF